MVNGTEAGSVRAASGLSFVKINDAVRQTRFCVCLPARVCSFFTELIVRCLAASNYRWVWCHCGARDET